MEVTMEHRLHLHRWERREPDWSAAAVSGFAAGAVLMVLELLWAAAAGSMGPWRISQLVAAIALGSDTGHASESFSVGIVAVALATHYVLGTAFGMVLGFISAGFRYDTGPLALAVVGLLFGALLYLASFHVATQAFPWLVELRGWSTFAAHLVFGVTASLLYWKLARRRQAPRPGP
jgi:F0F1-type ATP synthase assembly protein I